MEKSIKRYIPLIMALVVILSSMPQGILAQLSTKDASASVAAVENPATDFEYNSTNLQIEITGYVGTATEVVIPSKIQGYPVTNIAKSAFYNCNSVKSIVIPESVTTIGDSAFSYCGSLENVTIPNSVTSLGNSAFSYCYSLTSVTLSQNITSIGLDTFYQCNALSDISIPEGIMSIGNSAFAYCSSLTNITIPNGVTDIANSAFAYCSSLTRLIIPNSVKSIGKSAFKGCDLLENITIPDSVKSIGDSAFAYCYSLTEIKIPAEVTCIGMEMFYDCASLGSVTIPDSVTSIGVSAFNGCTSLEDVYYAGDEAKWNDIDIKISGNSALLNANVYFNGDTGDSVLTSAEISTINSLLCAVSDECKNMSKAELNRKIAEYAAKAFELGVTDKKTIALCVNIILIGGESELVRVLAKTNDFSLEGVYAALVTDTGVQVGTHRKRNWEFYKSCAKLEL